MLELDTVVAELGALTAETADPEGATGRVQGDLYVHD
jgi:hypothetical protein